MSRMNTMAWIGMVLVIVGIIGFAYPRLTTERTEEVARIGDLSIQNENDTTWRIPPYVAGGAILLGVLMFGGGLVQRR